MRQYRGRGRYSRPRAVRTLNRIGKFAKYALPIAAAAAAIPWWLKSNWQKPYKDELHILLGQDLYDGGPDLDPVQRRRLLYERGIPFKSKAVPKAAAKPIPMKPPVWSKQFGRTPDGRSWGEI